MRTVFPPGSRLSGLTPMLPMMLVCFAAACSDSGATKSTTPNATTPNTTTSESVGSPRASRAARRAATTFDRPVLLEVFAPGDGDNAGINGVGWFVDIDLEFPGNIRSTGFTGNQLTGPDVHNDVAPFPGVFAPGKDDRFGGLVVLFSTTTIGAGSCQNLANLFNITGPTNRSADGSEIWDTWIITAPNFGQNTASTMTIAEIKDLNHDGIFNDAPDVVPDFDDNGICDNRDVKALGISSNMEVINFFIR